MEDSRSKAWAYQTCKEILAAKDRDPKVMEDAMHLMLDILKAFPVESFTVENALSGDYPKVTAKFTSGPGAPTGTLALESIRDSVVDGQQKTDWTFRRFLDHPTYGAGVDLFGNLSPDARPLAFQKSCIEDDDDMAELRRDLLGKDDE